MSAATRKLFALTLAGGIALTGCAASATAQTPSGAQSSPASEADARVTLTYDGGLYVLDGESLDLLADIPLAGFNRVKPRG